MKPKRNIYKNYIDINTIVSRLTDLRYRLCKTVEYFAIEININGESFKNDHRNCMCYYKWFDKWCLRKRINTINGPACIPI